MPSRYGPNPVVAEAGASALGADDTDDAAGVGRTSAAVDPMPTCCGPAGVATVMVPDFAGDAALAPAPAPPVAVAVAPTVLTFPEPWRSRSLLAPVAGAAVGRDAVEAGAEAFGAADTAAAAGAALMPAAVDPAETVFWPAGVATLTVPVLLAGAAALAEAAAFEEVSLLPPPPPPPPPLSPPNTGRFMKRSSSRIYMLYPPMLGKTPFRRPRCASTFRCSPYSALKNLRRWRHTNNTSLGPPGTIRSTKTRHSPSSLLKTSGPS